MQCRRGPPAARPALRPTARPSVAGARRIVIRGCPLNLSDLLNQSEGQAWSVANRSLGLAWDPSVASVLAPTLLPQRSWIREGVCEGMQARVACLTADVALPVELYVGVPFTLTLTCDQGTKRSFPLVVAEASPGHADGGVMTVNFVARDPLWFMSHKRRLRVFRGMNPCDVVARVFDEWIGGSPMGGIFAYRFLGVPSDRYPPREQFIQHPDESDAEFVERLMRAAGIAWVWRPKPASVDAAPQALELLLFDDGWLLPANDAPRMKFHRRDGTERADAVDLLAPVQRWVQDRETVVSWDYEAAQANSVESLSGFTQGRSADALARALDSIRVAAPHLGDDPGDLDRLARIQANHQAFRARGLNGRGGMRTMAPGTWQVVDGHALLDLLPEQERSYVIVRVEHFTENSLPAELNPAAQALIGDDGVPAWACGDRRDKLAGSAQRYSNRFDCVPRNAPIQPTYVAERDEPRRRRLTGIVTARNGELTTDGLGRSLVQLIGGPPGADTTAWVRHPVQWGGRSHGHVGPLRRDTEVELEYLGPDRYVIAGVYYNGKTPPPLFDHLAGLPANAALSGIVSRELGGDRQQQLRFDDSPGSIGVQIGTDESATQVNLGCLRTPMDRGNARPRGRGLEMRTDAAAALRSGEGLLVSAWKRLQAAGQALDADEHLALMKDFADLFQGLGDYAARHQGLGADPRPTTELAADVRSGTAPTISITAPAGIATTTPRTLMSHAGVDIDSVALQHQQLTAGGQFLVNAGKGASIFVHQGDLSAISHHGRLVLQSQHDDTCIDSAKDLKATAAGKMIHVAEEITFMTTGGAFISLKGGKVTIGGSEALDVNTDGHHWNGPATRSGDLPTFGDGDMGRLPKIVSPLDGGPVEGVSLHVGRADADDLSGRTDAAGQASRITANGLQRLKSLFYFRRS